VARVSSPRVCLYPVLSDCFWATIVLTARPAEDIYFLVVGSRTELSLCVMVDIYEFLIFGDVSVWHTASAVLFVSAFLFFGEAMSSQNSTSYGVRTNLMTILYSNIIFKVSRSINSLLGPLLFFQNRFCPPCSAASSVKVPQRVEQAFAE
jgi:hypothetical protein